MIWERASTDTGSSARNLWPSFCCTNSTTPSRPGYDFKMRFRRSDVAWLKSADDTFSSRCDGRASASLSSMTSTSNAMIWLPRSFASNLPFTFTMASSWMASAFSSYLKQMHST